jgi:thioredoxin 1
MKKGFLISVIIIGLVVIIFKVVFLSSEKLDEPMNIILPQEVEAKSNPEKTPTEVLEDAMKLGKPVVIDFYSDYCNACSEAAPAFKKVSKEYAPKATFMKVNVDDEVKLSREFKVYRIPAVFVVNPKTRSAVQVPTVTIFNKKTFEDSLDQIFGAMVD